MTRMVLHPEVALDHLRNPGQGPQIGGKTGCQRSCQQGLLQLFPLLGCQSGRTPRMWPGFQGGGASLIQGLLPAMHRGWRCPDQPGNFADTLPFLQKFGGNPPPDFQFFGTAFWSLAVIITDMFLLKCVDH